ncbi:MAG TPA: response regulator, partial [Steroidobacteraceae bacterium]|nr:response regulator [Steroidobacteraceae bacterium]
MIRLMFVDDESRVLDGLRRSMHGMRSDWSMRFASTGADALQQLAQQPADVVVSDMRMPEMDGSQFLAHVMRLYPETIRFVLSGQSETEASIRATRSAHRYLSKPCSAPILQAAITRATHLKRVLNNDSLAAIVGSVDTLPTPPLTYQQLRERLAGPDASISDVVDVLERDVALTAKVVKLANSGFFGCRDPVQSIERAVSFLGMDAISALVLGKELYDTGCVELVPGFSLERLGQHSFQTAAWARAVALHEGLPAAMAERAFLSGVLHDVGRLVFATRHAPSDEQSRQRWRGDTEIQMIRQHAAAGAYLLGLWAFPESIVEAVLWHHAPSQSGESGLGLSALLHIGDQLAHEHDPIAARPARLETGYLESLDLGDRWPVWSSLRQEIA